MKNLRPLISALSAFAVMSTALVANATDYTGVQWPDCDCPNALKVTLASWDFENMTSGQSELSAPASYVYPGVIAYDVFGPTNVVAQDQGGNQWGSFAGFPSNGEQGTVAFDLAYNSSELLTLSGFSFDVFSSACSTDNGIHGPTNFFVNVLVNGDHVWQSELVTFDSGLSNQFNWNISNPDGNDFNFDGQSLTGGDFSWRQLDSGDVLAFQIVAAGATSGTESLHLDNINVFACVPEPSGALLLMVAGMVVLARMRRSRLASV